MTRIDATFDRLRAEGKKAFVAYVMAGDPDEAKSMDIFRALPEAGVDIIELGVPFTDPMADGPTIQLAGQRIVVGQGLDGVEHGGDVQRPVEVHGRGPWAQVHRDGVAGVVRRHRHPPVRGKVAHRRRRRPAKPL